MSRDVVMRRGRGLMNLMCPSFSRTFTRNLGGRSVRHMVRRGHITLGTVLPTCDRVSGVGVCPRRFRGAPGGSVGEFLCRRTGKWGGLRFSCLQFAVCS